MKRAAVVNVLLAVFVSVASVGAGAASQRTFVAPTGLDTNPCTLVAPCRGFATALALTLAGGEIVVLGSAGYGAVTIDRSVAIVAPPGLYAGISVSAGDGITIATGGVDVTLKGLTLTGLGGGDGIKMLNGARLSIAGCEISGFVQNGIDVQATGSDVFIADTIVRDNGQSGIYLQGALNATLERIRATGNTYGVYARAGPVVVLRDSTVSRNAQQGVAVESLAAGITTRMVVEAVTASANGAQGMMFFSGLGGTVNGGAQRSLSTGNGAQGIAVRTSYNGSGFGDLEFVDNVVRDNAQEGIVFTGLNSTVVVSGNTIVRNAGVGLYRVNGGSGAIQSRSTNTIYGNVGGNINDPLTFLPAQ